MSTLLFIDSAYPLPQSQIPAGISGVGGYIGGDTPHTWTSAEWAAQKTRYRLPVYVRSNPPGPGADVDVSAAVAQLKILGCPQGSLVAWDLETAADAAYIRQVFDLLSADGYKLIVYGSQSDVLGNDNPDGLYWGADWTSVAHLHSPDQVTQYVSFANYDLSVAQSTLPFWDTAPLSVPVPPAPEPAVSVPVPTISLGADDRGLLHWYVHRLQAILNAVYGAHLTIDGIYGAASESAVKTVQARYRLTQDGVVGPQTWEKVLAG